MKKDRKYCNRHAGDTGTPSVRGGFIHPKYGCIRCLANRQTRNYVPAEDFYAKRIAKATAKAAA